MKGDTFNFKTICGNNTGLWRRKTNFKTETAIYFRVADCGNLKQRDRL